MTLEKDLIRIFNELLTRIQNIGIALQSQGIRPIKVLGHYDLSRTDTPSIEETEDAFMNWNCAIITAFRGSDTLTAEANLERNIKRNNELKEKMIKQGLCFRSVNGCYREARWEKPNVEYCFFVTNTGESRLPSDSVEQAKDFFCKMYRLAEYYEQDSFLFTFPGANRVAFLVATNEDGRRSYKNDIKFAGPLFTHVSDIGDWTDCSNGRISFRLKGMIIKGGTGNKKIKLGEGDLFDIDSYEVKGLVVLRSENEKKLDQICKSHDQSSIPLVQHEFKKEPTKDNLHRVIYQCLKQLCVQKCKIIGFLCNVPINGSTIEGAKCAYESIMSWTQLYEKKLDRIIIVDTYGNYNMVINDEYEEDESPKGG